MSVALEEVKPEMLEAVCSRFRTKAMVDRGEELVRNARTLAFPYCWCGLTLRDLGPDEHLVNLPRCCRPSRNCYQRQQSLNQA